MRHSTVQPPPSSESSHAAGYGDTAPAPGPALRDSRVKPLCAGESAACAAAHDAKTRGKDDAEALGECDGDAEALPVGDGSPLGDLLSFDAGLEEMLLVGDSDGNGLPDDDADGDTKGNSATRLTERRRIPANSEKTRASPTKTAC